MELIPCPSVPLAPLEMSQGQAEDMGLFSGIAEGDLPNFWLVAGFNG